MNIAILRTEQADAARAYNKVEYAAAFQGARVAAYVLDRPDAWEFADVPYYPEAMTALSWTATVPASRPGQL